MDRENSICRPPHNLSGNAVIFGGLPQHHMSSNTWLQSNKSLSLWIHTIDWLSVKFHSNRLSRIHVRTLDLSVRGYTIYNAGLCLWPLRWEGCLSWHTWCDTEPWSTRSHPKNRSACFLMGQARCTQNLLYPETQGRNSYGGEGCDYAIYNLWTHRFYIYICSLITSQKISWLLNCIKYFGSFFNSVRKVTSRWYVVARIAFDLSGLELSPTNIGFIEYDERLIF